MKYLIGTSILVCVAACDLPPASGGGWEAEDREVYLQTCKSTAGYLNLSPAQATVYCNCTFDGFSSAETLTNERSESIMQACIADAR